MAHHSTFGTHSAPDKVTRTMRRSLKRVVDILLFSVLLISAPLPALAGEPTAGGSTVFTYTSIRDEASTYSGAYTKRVPLEIPPGRNGLQPDLALEYNSQRMEDSVVGYGWQLSIPYIERLNKTGSERLYVDNYFSSSLGGELATSTPTEYQHRVEDGQFIRYTFTDNVWTAFDKKGTRYTFGSTTQAQQFDPAATSSVIKWMLEEVRDTNDNYIKFIYQNDSNELYPSQIVYAGHGSTDGVMTIEFATSTRPDPIIRYIAGVKVTTNYRITEITASVSGDWVRKFSLAYAPGSNGVRSMLAGIQKTGKDAESNELSLPTMTFSYSSSTNAFVTTGNPTILNAAYLVTDVNGNGANDIVSFYYDNFTGTRKGYIKYDNGSEAVSFSVPESWGNRPVNQSSYLPNEGGVRFFDVNGDGWADIVRGDDNRDTSTFTKKIYLSSTTSARTWTEVASSTWTGDVPPFVYTNSPYGFTTGLLGELNGDGVVDYVARVENHVAPTAYMGTGLGWVATTTVFSAVNSFPSDTGPFLHNQLVDINGDGLDDWVHSDDNTTYVRLNTGFGWESTPDSRWTLATSTYYGSARWDRGMRFIDINADGLVDFVRAYHMPAYSCDHYVCAPEIEVATTKYAFLNTGSGWATSTVALPEAYIFNGTVSSASSWWQGNYTFNEFVDLSPGQENQDVLSGIHLPESGSITIEYATTGGQATHANLPIALLVVSKITTDDNNGNAEEVTYSYHGGEMYVTDGARERKLAGFGIVIEQSSLGTTKTYYHQGNIASTTAGELTDHRALIGRAYREDVLSLSGAVLRKTFYRWQVDELGVAFTSTTTNTHSSDLERGSSQHLGIADASQAGLDFSTAFTLSGWFKFESLPTNGDAFLLINKGRGDDNQRAYAFFALNDGQQKLRLRLSGNGTSAEDETVAWSPSTGTWYHLAVTYDGSTVKFYLDGAQLGTDQSTAVGSVFNSNRPFKIGAGEDSLGGPEALYDGLVDDVRVWSRVLSGSDVADLYANAATFNNGANLQGSWGFNNAYTDASGNANTLTAYNSPVFAVDSGESSAAPDSYVYDETNYANPHAATGIWLSTATATISYDNNGNVTAFGTTTYGWDWRNRMTAATVNGANTTYGYDHTTARVAQRTPSKTFHYPTKFYSVEYEGTSTTTGTSTSYLWQGDTLVAYIEQPIANGQATGTPTIYYTHPDHLGSTNVVTNASGTVVQTLDYYPYGSERVNQDLGAQSQRTYIGEIYDPESELNYLNSRYYRSSQGQFLSQDPVFLSVGNPGAVKGLTGISQSELLMDPQSLHSYSYARNNPIRFSDPQGLWYREFLTGQQSWPSFYGEVGEAANYLGQSSPAWNFGMNHPVASGMVIVGPLSGIAAASGLSAYAAFHAVGAQGVGAAYAAKHAFAGLVYSLLTGSTLNAIPSNLTALSQGGPGSYYSTLGSLAWNSASLLPGYGGALVDTAQFGGLVGQGIINMIQSFSSSNIQTRAEAVNSFNSAAGASSNESKLWTTPGGTVVDWYGTVVSPAPSSQ